jgi:hypothetical protein
MYWYDAPRRIWEYNPSMKLILLLRNPIERAYSHWNMQRDRGNEKLSFMEAIQEEENRRKASLPYQNRRFSYLDRGFYSEQIRRLKVYFPQDQILIIRNEDLREKPEKTVGTVCQFIGVSPLNIAQELDLHSRDYQTNLEPEIQRYLADLYRLEIKQIEQLTGWDCQEWLEPTI